MIAVEKSVAEMTLNDLRTMIRREIRQQVETKELYGGLLAHNHSKRSFEEVLESIRRNRVPDVEGAPSVVETLREDRDSR